MLHRPGCQCQDSIVSTKFSTGHNSLARGSQIWLLEPLSAEPYPPGLSISRPKCKELTYSIKKGFGVR